MKIKLVTSYLVVFITVTLCSSLAIAQVPDLPGWDLVWNDEFDGTSLNTDNWEALFRQDSFNNEKQFYHPNQVAVNDGNLELTAINVPLGNKAYQSGLVTSQDLFGPGRFEARIDLPTSQGMWPAFWLNANHVDWPQGGEIDILENRGSQPNLVSSAYHWQTNPGPCCDQHQYVFNEYTATEGGQPVNFHDSFHTYAAEWDETEIKYYVDGNLYHTVTESANRPIFETQKNIILNVAVGGNFGGDPDGTTVFPQTMYVDYVRYWQRSTDPVDPPAGVNLLLNPGFDQSGGSMNNWTDFGNAIPNVSADGSLPLDGSHALKIFGQFNGQPNYSGASQGVAIDGGESLTAMASAQSPSWDTLFGKSNEVSMKIEFYSSFGAAYGSSSFLGEVIQLIHDGSTAQGVWHEHMLEATAPEDAVEARLTFQFYQPGSDNGAIWIDSAGLFVDSAIEGDLNNDGFVDGVDLGVQLGNWGQNVSPSEGELDGTAPVNGLDLGVLLGAWNPPPATAAATVPEPSSVLLILIGMFFTSSKHKS